MPKSLTSSLNSFDLTFSSGFRYILTAGDNIHVGLWPQNKAELSLVEAQQALSQFILDKIPKEPIRILDVGCGLGATSDYLMGIGHQVVAIDPSYESVCYAQINHPGPEYLCCGFLDQHPKISAPEQYDLILFQESVNVLPELHSVFDKAKKLLCPKKGRLIMCDAVIYDQEICAPSKTYSAIDIEEAFHEAGFFIRYHEKIGPQVSPTFRATIQLIDEQRADSSNNLGPEYKKSIANYIDERKQLSTLYFTGKAGYETWDIRPSDFQIRSYKKGDETEILKAFEVTFGSPRDLEHWRWKFLCNPFGGPYISSAWDEDKIVAHYTAYPVPIYFCDHITTVYQVGDTFTLPLYRGVGRGNSSLLGRLTRHFHRLYCENKIPFFYGFLTGTHQKFGRLFLRYSTVAPVQEWEIEEKKLKMLSKAACWPYWLSGYSVIITESVGSWADEIFDNAKHDFNWLIARKEEYLKWRYEENPDHKYVFSIVRKWGKPTGWWVARIEDNSLIVVDALFPRKESLSPIFGLLACIQKQKEEHLKIKHVTGWFSETPEWWNNKLVSLGFRPHKQKQNLDFCVTIFEDELDPREIGNKFYFTSGDSDLF